MKIVFIRCCILLFITLLESGCGGSSGGDSGSIGSGSSETSNPTASFSLETVLSDLDVSRPQSTVFAGGKLYFGHGRSVDEVDPTTWLFRTIVGYTNGDSSATGLALLGPSTPVSLYGSKLYFGNAFGSDFGLVTASVAQDNYEPPSIALDQSNLTGCCNLSEEIANTTSFFWFQNDGTQNTDVFTRPIDRSKPGSRLTGVVGSAIRARANATTLFVNAENTSSGIATIYRIDVASGTTQVIWTGPSSAQNDTTLGLSGQHVLWTVNSTVYESNLDGSNVVTVADAGNTIISDPIEINSGVYVLTTTTDTSSGDTIDSIVWVNSATAQSTVVHQENGINTIAGNGSLLYWIGFAPPTTTLYSLGSDGQAQALATLDSGTLQPGSGPQRMEVSASGYVAFTDGSNLFQYDPTSQTTKAQNFTTSPSFSSVVGDTIYFGDQLRDDILAVSLFRDFRPWSVINNPQIAANEATQAFEIESNGKMYVAAVPIVPRQDYTIASMNLDGSAYLELYSVSSQPTAITLYNNQLFWLCADCGSNGSAAVVSAPVAGNSTPTILGNVSTEPTIAKINNTLYVLGTGNGGEDVELSAVNLDSGQIASLTSIAVRGDTYSVVAGNNAIYLSAGENSTIGYSAEVARFPIISWNKLDAPEIYLDNSQLVADFTANGSVFDGTNFYFWKDGLQKVIESE